MLREAASIEKYVVYFARQGVIEKSGSEGLKPLTIYRKYFLITDK